ncbi:MAG: ROK family protein [Christensenellaceae bacterium]|jgi:glucokinase|nr:ROK family protein [Christensenellaceae bacterium]
MVYRIGVDIGGTKIAAGLLDDNLDFVAISSIPFMRVGGEAVSAAVAAQIRGLLAEAGIGEQALQSIGVAVPGSLDAQEAVVLDAHNLGFHGEPLRAQMQAHFPAIPVYLANDANAAALGELHKGAFVGCQTAALLTLGTGLGGGLILNGRMFNGGRGNGIEVGHTVLVDGGEPCTCGIHGCSEAYCSATALIREANRALRANPAGMLHKETGGDPARMTAKLAIDCAKAGDAAAKQVFDAYVGHLGSVVVSIIHMLDPEVIAIGGGVCRAGDFLFDPLREDVRAKCFFGSYAKICAAQLGNEAGIIGAAMLHYNKAR